MTNETLYLAVNILDRFLQKNPRITEDDYSLAGLTCLFIAGKYEEIYPP